MKLTIAVKDKLEGDLIGEGLNDPEVRAMVIVAAALKRLPSDGARVHALGLVRAMLDARAEEES